MSELEPLIRSRVWRGIFKNINFEICEHMFYADGGPWWNTYIILNSHYNPNYLEYLWVTDFKEFERYNGKIHKYQEPKEEWDVLSWNGGQTFYEQKEYGDFKSIKIGDDYQHSWDYEKGRAHLGLDYLTNRCKIMIDELILLMTKNNIIEKMNDMFCKVRLENHGIEKKDIGSIYIWKNGEFVKCTTDDIERIISQEYSLISDVIDSDNFFCFSCEKETFDMSYEML